MRAVAVLLVVLSHGWIVVDGLNDVPVLGRFGRSGFLGVDIFFVLSGFLITSLLLREHQQVGRVSFARFYLRRAIRLLPALYVMLLVFAIYTHHVDYNNLFGSPDLLHRTVRNALTYTSNWQIIDDPLSLGDVGQLWSLAIEEQFYIVWPAALVLLLRFRHRIPIVVTVLVTLVVAVTIRRALVFETEGWSAAYHGSTTRVDGLLIGALTGFLWVHRLTPTRHLRPAAWSALGAMVIVMLFARGEEAFTHYGGLTVFNVSVAVVVLAVVQSGWSAGSVLTRAGMQLVGPLPSRSR
jgi:peptidoglycan/LPS O-acetylase OafA/YrhL